MCKRYVIQDLVSGMYWNGFDNNLRWGKSIAYSWMFQYKETADNTITQFENKFEGIVVTIIEVYV